MFEKPFNKIYLFTFLTLLLSVVLWGSLAVLGIPVSNLETGGTASAFVMFIFVLNGFVPSIIGICLLLKTEKDGKEYLRTLFPQSKERRSAIHIVLIFFGSFIIQIVLYNLFVGGFNFEKVSSNLYQILPLIILGPLSEEIGWRGYLQKQVLKITTPLRSSFIIGIIWALWHLPLFYIIGTTQQVNDVNFITFTLMLVLVSWIMTYFYIKTEGSLFIAVFIHWVYTVVMSFYVLGTEYSLISDWIAIGPLVLISMFIFFEYKKMDS